MKRGLLVFLTMCALANAMVPRDRRAVNAEEEEDQSSKASVEICASVTPCAWVVYDTQMHITNNFCVCSADTVCRQDEVDDNNSTYVHRCLGIEEKSKS